MFALAEENGGLIPLYRLIEDESQQVVFTAHDIEGFFVESAGESSYVRARGAFCRPTSNPAHLRDVALQVLDVQGEVIGSYYIGEAEILDCGDVQSDGRVDLVISFLGYSLPFPYAGEIWRRWASGFPQRRGDWRRLSPDWHPSWLHVVQAAWFEAGRLSTRYGLAANYIADGSGITNLAGLYCEIGEAVNGAGGYFGSGLDALADCLRSGARADPFELLWRNFDLLRDGLGESEVDSVVSLMREFGVRVTVEAHP